MGKTPERKTPEGKRPEELPPEGLPQNLSDFALFQSVMKNKEAHEIVLSIIMEKPDLRLEAVRVEEVILNEIEKRAIRLDAWAEDFDSIQYNTEMQNDTKQDDMRRRARFYQGMIDTPILKSGKRTKYKHLPDTAVIFITQEDIFGKNRAKYTFMEQCEEITGLHLEDGTKKIFLNLTSLNGSPELVNLLQYIKNTSLENPMITTKSEKLLRLDEIVSEVKESKEWEELHMSIYSIAYENGQIAGKEIGKEIGARLGEELKLLKQICKKLSKGKSEERIADEVEEDLSVVHKAVAFISGFAPNYDENAIVGAWLKMKEENA